MFKLIWLMKAIKLIHVCFIKMIKIILLVIYPSLITHLTGLERETKVPIVFKIF